MSDVLFRYLLTARRRDQSAFRRLVFVDEPLLEAGVEQLVESAAARVEVKSQHERVTRRKETVPASRHRSVRFYEVATPTRPRQGTFERRSQEFPLQGTLKIYTCTNCHGSGEVRCRRCNGKGRIRCAGCRGTGRSEGRGGSCRRCGGDGRVTCDRCRGRRRVTCGSCLGEGKLASWEVEVYRWLIEERSGDELPLETEQARVAQAFDRWLEIDADRVVSFKPGKMAAHLGFETPETLAVALRAETRRQALEAEARRSGDRYLFHRTALSLTPVGYTVLRWRKRARYYWLVGRGERALEVSPRGRLDGWKCTGWLGLGSGGVMGYESLAQAYELGLPLLEVLQLGAEPAWLAGGSLASWLLTALGVRRVRQHKPPVRTIGLLAPTGRPTSYLPCLAYVGSYLGQLRVIDSAYDIQSQRLLGRMRPARQSESLSIELPDGRKARLVEVANPHQLTESQLRLMVRALDGMIILRESEQTDDDLETRIVQVAETPPLIGSLLIGAHSGSRSDVDLRDADAGLPLETARRVFVRDMDTDFDWQLFFDRMWQPLAELLAALREAEAA